MAQHLTLVERQFLHRMVRAKKSKAEIGALMNRHRSTIYRELKRNSNAWGYRPETARATRGLSSAVQAQGSRHASVCQ